MFRLKAFFNEHKLVLMALTAIYFCLSFLYLINQGIYWDDWWLTSLTNADRMEMFRQTGYPIFSYIHLPFLNSPFPLFFYRVVQFLCGYITAICIYSITQKEIVTNKYWAFWITIFFIVIPLNFARITLICFPYILCTTCFYLACTLALFARKENTFRIIAYALFFLSFFTNSLVSFYSLFILILFWQNMVFSNLFNPKHLLKFFQKNLDFILLPIIFIVFKFFIFPKPYGQYANYQVLRPISMSLLSESKIAFHSVLTNLISADPLSYFQTRTSVGILLGVLVLAKLYPQKVDLINKCSSFFDQDKFFKLLLIVVVSLLFALLPYILIGRSAIYFASGWEDRDTLLLPFGISLYFAAMILFLLSSQFTSTPRWLRSWLSLGFPLILAAAFFYATLSTQIQLLKDSIKQDSILLFMRSEPSFKDNYTFVVTDNCPQFNIYSRNYESYELNGMAQSVFGNQKRLFSKTENFSALCPDNENSKMGGICKEWKKSNASKYLVIDQAMGTSLGQLKTVRLTFFKLFKKERYEKEVSNIFSLKLLNPEEVIHGSPTKKS